MTASTIENVLNTMRLAALSTTDYLTRDFLLQAIGENEEKAAVTLSETCWGEVFDPLDADNRRHQIRSTLKKSTTNKGETHE